MKIRSFIMFFVAAFAGGIISIFVYAWATNQEGKHALMLQKNQPVRYASYIPGMSGNLDFTVAAEKSIHFVVHVKTQYKQYLQSNNIYDFFFGSPYAQQEPATASGSGVIVSDNGYIVTNNHVIENSDYIEVVLNNKQSYPAKLIGTDKTTDIALLKIDASGLPFVNYGNSDDLKIGEWVLAVGNPFNLTSTVTAGIVSAKARNINILSKQFAIESFIQTDAAVNPGNSGGALVNTNGDLVGINTAIASNTGSFTGYSFAIPVNIVKKIVEDIIQYGEVQRAFIGASIVDIDAALAKQLNLDKIEGVYIAGVNEGGSAAESGIKEGDIILSINDKIINNVPELQEQISKYRPGDKINVDIKREGKKKNLSLELRNKLGNTAVVKTETVSALGAKFEEITTEDMRRLRIDFGLKIVELQAGKLRAKGITEGFIIRKINRQPIKTFNDLKDVIKKSTDGAIYIEGIYPNGMTAYYAFGLK